MSLGIGSSSPRQAYQIRAPRWLKGKPPGLLPHPKSRPQPTSEVRESIGRIAHSTNHKDKIPAKRGVFAWSIFYIAVGNDPSAVND